MESGTNGLLFFLLVEQIILIHSFNLKIDKVVVLIIIVFRQVRLYNCKEYIFMAIFVKN